MQAKGYTAVKLLGPVLKNNIGIVHESTESTRVKQRRDRQCRSRICREEQWTCESVSQPYKSFSCSAL